ncbi:MAG: 16S rRNA (cytidine(1402)-2'-O)-methyltransferase [Gammaproteobacteria bacterium]|nr:16S rRNA (cytidine(1402)-2'-O)-methyltransferase [Gammaproteobacteria bacterium]MBU2678243.1 16S rRNA (cytidine(1402)-2'-O)-methyltransferase [Gammaproteobacteria bacterium]NNC56052.1 16S rRNA (cytidine(1402)-2'-O)-methyltransferase [Woeseiaceae bacterium]NNL51978.1 16S rRNA (cytidine(1402)-2'-O)-methyltransferase [Woeseiaceae bacterium]
MSGKLFIVATPIGNLEDLTPRARKTLAEVDLVAAEDTRHTGRLLSHIGVKAPLLALHDHNEAQAVSSVIAALESGKSIALVSDAGTPLVSDPGYRLVQAAHAHSIVVSPIPGPCAVTAALSVAGLPTDRFCFEGFLPAKQAARRQVLDTLCRESRTLVFYESVHRITAVLEDMCAAFGDGRLAFIGRELTKLHEQCVQGTLGSLAVKVRDAAIVRKGEFVIVVAGSDEIAESSLEVDRLLVALNEHLSAKDAARVAADATGLKRNDVYKRLMVIRG